MFQFSRFALRISNLGSTRISRILHGNSLTRQLVPLCALSSTVQTTKPRAAQYLEQFKSDTQQCLPERLIGKSSDELRSLIDQIINQYEYELYRMSYELLETEEASDKNMIEDRRFHLELHELNDILHANDDTERRKIINYFVSAKTSKFVTKERKKSEIASREERIKYDLSRRTVQHPTGLWNFENELIYGLWHNALFIKFKRSSLSQQYERRMVSPMVMDASNSRLILDFDYVPYLDYFNIRRLGTQISRLIAHNKYKVYQPFSLEFTEAKQRRSTQFEDLMSRIVPNWKQEEGFQYVRHQGKTVDQLASNPRSIFYILPSARKALTVAEVLNPDAVFVLPAYCTGNLRDPVFSKMKSEMHALNINTRRLPTAENVVWDKFHGVMSLDSTFSVLSDARYEINFDWTASFRRHLKGEILKKDEDLRDMEKIREERYKKRAQSVEKFYIETYSRGPRGSATKGGKKTTHWCC